MYIYIYIQNINNDRDESKANTELYKQLLQIVFPRKKERRMVIGLCEGYKVGPYTLMEVLGEGGSATVCKSIN